jgi:hypothetical protein
LSSINAQPIMTYDHKSRTLSLGDSSDFPADSGAFFVNVLREVAREPNAPKRIADDWNTLANWLGCGDRELTASDNAKIGEAYRSYLARGISPSKALDESFRSFAQQAKAESWPLSPVPRAICGVFDGLLATDAELKMKRVADALEIAEVLQGNFPPSRGHAATRRMRSRWRQTLRGHTRSQRALFAALGTGVLYLVLRIAGTL